MSISQQPTIGQRLLQERKKHSWSQQMLAEKIGTTVLNINRWEHNKTQPQPYYRERLCEVFGKSHDELFGEPEEERTPLWNIPHLRNLYFTGREEILTRLHDALTTTTKKAVAITQAHAISGLGGIGKTQTAVEYAYRYSDEYKAILWARADSHESLVSELVSFATVLDLPEKQEADQRKVVAAVLRWLQNAQGWLLIYDNADDLEMASEFLPTRGAGQTLLTTRSQATGKYIKGIEIEKMGREEGALLLLRRAKFISEDASLDQASEAQRRDAETICELMDGLPLALDQAAAYIEENECSLSDYLSLYQTRRATLLKRRGTFSKRDYPKPVATTWSLSFEQVQRDHPAAADLLRLCAFLHPDAIPEEMIVAGASELGPPLQPVAEDPIQLADAIGALRKYSLVRRNPEAKTLTIHRLVQTVLKDGMEEETQHQWAERIVRAVNHALPEEVVFATWQHCQRCLPHAQICATLIEQWGMRFVEAARLLYQTGCYLRDRAQYTQAEVFLKRALMLREKLLGADHPEIATTLDSLASIYFAQGKYLQAESLYQQALTIREQSLGPDHPTVATSLNILAHLRYFLHENTYDEAEQMFRRALAIREKALGRDHPDVAFILETFGHLYSYQGKYEQALSLYQPALKIRERVLGSDHPDLVDLLDSMGRIYSRMGQYDQAEAFYRRALTACEALEPEHPQIGLLLDNMGILFTNRGSYDKAEQYFKRSLAIHEKVLGMVHPHIAKCLDNFAVLYLILARYDQAEALAQRALAIHEQTLGPEHADCTIVLGTLAEIYLAEGKYAQTAPILQRALTILEKDQRPTHPYLAHTYISLAELSSCEGRYSEAEVLYQKGLGILEEIYGPDHLDIAETLLKVGKHCIMQGKYGQAEPLCTQALALYEKRQRVSRIDMAYGLAIQALLFSKQGRYEEAEALCTRAEAIYVETIGPRHPSVAFCLSILAGVYQAQGDDTRAKSLYERALEIWEQTVAPEHIDVIACKEGYRTLLHALTEHRETQAQEQ